MNTARSFVAFVLLPLLSPLLPCGRAAAADADEIPAEAPRDAVMASDAQVQTTADWALAAFAGRRATLTRGGIAVEVQRQDHNVVQFGRSCMETPLRIGSRGFAHGLGVHAASVVVVSLPAPAKRFQAMVGVDNNFDTQGRLGTVQFAVEADGRQRLRTPTLRGGQEPAPIDLALPPGTRRLVLTVDATSDGPSNDQADWADARVVLDDGRTLYLDDATLPFLELRLPFSFQYGKTPSAEGA